MFPLSKFYNDVDTMDIAKLKDWFSDDIVVRFGNADEVSGCEKAIQFISGFLKNVKKMSHNLIDSVENNGKIYLEATVSYTLPDGRVFCFPVVTFIGYDSTKLKALRVFLDPSPMFAS